ncbi:MAG TPA: ABC transporter permease, partial [Polyangiaceae bacterium]
EVLFEPGRSPIGEYVKIRGLFFRVVGVQRSSLPGQEGERGNSTLYVPFSTFQVAFNNGNRVGWFAVAAHPDVPGPELEAAMRRALSVTHRVHPDDKQAFGSYNAAEKFNRMQSLFIGVKAFIWFVSIATLMAGALGVSNIMLISVKERTREIGVRKTLGATPAAIVWMVLQEAVVLTVLAGYLGLFLGVVALEAVASLVPAGSGPLAAPSVDLNVAVIAAAVLLVLGAVAGVAPARQAAKIRPVVALRSE